LVGTRLFLRERRHVRLTEAGAPSCPSPVTWSGGSGWPMASGAGRRRNGPRCGWG
jgi:hypothetical protein